MIDDNSSRNVLAVFDLTTTSGVERALKVARHPDFFSRLYAPIVGFAKEMVDKGLEFFRTATDTEATIKEQREAAVAVIMAGKDAGCSSIEITMDEAAGVEFGGKIGPNIDLRIISVGKTGKMTIRAEYK